MRIKPRKRWIAGILSLCTPGLGHIYCGRIKRAVGIYFLAYLVILAAMLLILMPFPFWNLILFGLLAVAALVIPMVDAVKLAGRSKEPVLLARFQRWYVYLGLYLVSALLLHPAITSIIRSNLVQAYQIPAASMEPTLLIGDQLLINKLAYLSNNPRYGDVIVFEFPQNQEITYIKRVIGVPGDEVQIKGRELFINGSKVAESFVRQPNLTVSPIAGRNAQTNFGPITVPPNSFFVLGDNRDNSADSRIWGFVDKSKVKGKACTIYFSWDGRTNSVRWNRIGKIFSFEGKPNER